MEIAALVRSSARGHDVSLRSGDAAAVAELLRTTDAVVEVHNTVRAGVPVELVERA